MQFELTALSQKFVERLEYFRPDETLETAQITEYPPNQIALAASGRSVYHVDFEHVGVLVSQEKNIMVRVFRRLNPGDYRLYFLHDKGKSLQGGIVKKPGTLNYFIIDSAHHTTIPVALGIDPLKEKLTLTLPDASFTLPEAELRQTVQTSGEVTLAVQETGASASDDSEMVEFRLSTPSGNKIPSKLLLQSNGFTRLIPVNNNRALVSFPKEFHEPLSCYCYE